MRLYEDQAGNSYDNMSDDDRDIDIDSDDGEDSDNTKSQPRNSSGGQFYSQVASVAKTVQLNSLIPENVGLTEMMRVFDREKSLCHPMKNIWESPGRRGC